MDEYLGDDAAEHLLDSHLGEYNGSHLAYYDDDDAMLSLINLFYRPGSDP